MNEPKPELTWAVNRSRSCGWRRSGPTSMAIARSIRATHPAILRPMRAVTFQAPYEVRVEEKPEPELLAPDDAIVRIEATGVCGSDLHIFHGRVKIEPGFTIGHEYVGEVVAAGGAGGRVRGGGRGRGRRRSRARLLPGGVRAVLRLPARQLPQVRRLADLRPRGDARLAAGHAG